MNNPTLREALEGLLDCAKDGVLPRQYLIEQAEAALHAQPPVVGEAVSFEVWLQAHPELYDKQPEEVAEIAYAAGQQAQRELDADWLKAYGFMDIDKAIRRGAATRDNIESIRKEAAIRRGEVS